MQTFYKTNLNENIMKKTHLDLSKIKLTSTKHPIKIPHQQKDSPSTDLGPVSNFIRERLSGLYYATSVAGYGSFSRKVSEYLEKNICNKTETIKWELDQIEFKLNSERLPIPSDKKYKYYQESFDLAVKNLRLQSDARKHVNTPNNFHLTKQDYIYTYLFKEHQESVSIITLENFTTLTFSNLLHCGDMVPITVPVDFISCKEKEISFGNTDILLTEILKKFPNKHIEIFFLLSSEMSTSDSIAGRLFSVITRDFSPYVSHRSYAKISIDPIQKLMNVKVVDPLFNPDKPLIRSVMASPEPLPEQSERVFQMIAKSSGLKLTNHIFLYRGDQVLNFHDCSRFSTIYLQAELEGKDCMSLSNFEIYQGFKKLEAGGYEKIHQTQTENFPIALSQSRFVTYITNPFVRYFPDLALKYFFS